MRTANVIWKPDDIQSCHNYCDSSSHSDWMPTKQLKYKRFKKCTTFAIRWIAIASITWQMAANCGNRNERRKEVNNDCANLAWVVIIIAQSAARPRRNEEWFSILPSRKGERKNTWEGIRNNKPIDKRWARQRSKRESSIHTSRLSHTHTKTLVKLASKEKQPSSLISSLSVLIVILSNTSHCRLVSFLNISFAIIIQIKSFCTFSSPSSFSLN